MERTKTSVTGRTHGYRSGKAARLAGMPVTTLRIWERRYGIVAPPTTASGQRLYSEDDVRRLVRIKALVDRGYAIGSIARLDEQQLAELEASNGQRAMRARADDEPVVLGLAVVGDVLPERLAEYAGELGLQGLQVRASYPSIGDFEAARARGAKVDAQILLVEVPGLWDETAEQVLRMTHGGGFRAAAVIYPFGSNGAAASLHLAGVRVYRRPGNRTELRQLLSDMRRECERERAVSLGGERVRRRFDDRHLVSLSGSAAPIACECPRHIVDLILQLDAFETYSDSCANDSPADRVLHRLLGDIANHARHAFESALEQIAAGHGKPEPGGA